MVVGADSAACGVVNTACVTNTQARTVVLHRRQVSDNFNEAIISLDLKEFYSFTVELNIKCIPGTRNGIGRGSELRKHGQEESGQHQS